MFIEQHAVDVYMEFNRNKIQFKKKMHIFTQELRTDTFFTWIPPPSTPKCQTVENAQT